MTKDDGDTEITLGVLNAVEKNSNITQRDVSKNIGIALGLTNTYLKRCVKKGFIKVQQVPANRYAYYLTPRGFAEKSRLTAEYLSQGFQFFRLARNQIADIFEICQNRHWYKIAIHGLNEISEIAVLCSRNFKIEIVGIVDRSSSSKGYAGIPVVSEIGLLAQCEAIVITDLEEPQTAKINLSNIFSNDRILAPRILNLSQQNDMEEVET